MLSPDAAVSAKTRSFLLYRALLLGFGLTLLGHDAHSQTTQPLRFAIAAQPLAAALNSYSTVSGVELYYDGELVLSRRSSRVNGMLEPDVALRELLIGTGLVARLTGSNSLTVVAATPSRVADTAVEAYFAAIQERVAQVLCSRAETRPGAADVLFQLWLTSTGAVQRARLLDAPGDRVRADAFATAVRKVHVGAAPPDGLPQPITIAILARDDGEPTGCARSSTAAAR